MLLAIYAWSVFPLSNSVYDMSMDISRDDYFSPCLPLRNFLSCDHGHCYPSSLVYLLHDLDCWLLRAFSTENYFSPCLLLRNFLSCDHGHCYPSSFVHLLHDWDCWLLRAFSTDNYFSPCLPLRNFLSGDHGHCYPSSFVHLLHYWDCWLLRAFQHFHADAESRMSGIIREFPIASTPVVPQSLLVRR